MEEKITQEIENKKIMSSSMNTQSKKNCAITEYWNKHDADFKFSTGINDIVPAQVLNSVGEMYRNNDLRLTRGGHSLVMPEGMIFLENFWFFLQQLFFH